MQIKWKPSIIPHVLSRASPIITVSGGAPSNGLAHSPLKGIDL